ncbi:MAG: hypothetical protein IJT05_02840, partial [Lachnospiraceae bacterium]|nr:hypothetical protein [Lachnospiraceae bacterium]
AARPEQKKLLLNWSRELYGKTFFMWDFFHDDKKKKLEEGLTRDTERNAELVNSYADRLKEFGRLIKLYSESFVYVTMLLDREDVPAEESKRLTALLQKIAEAPQAVGAEDMLTEEMKRMQDFVLELTGKETESPVEGDRETQVLTLLSYIDQSRLEEMKKLSSGHIAAPVQKEKEPAPAEPPEREEERRAGAEKAMQYLFRNPRYKRQTLRLRILKGQDLSPDRKEKNRHDGKPVERAMDRIETIESLNRLIRDIFEAVRMEPPLTFYAYKKSRLSSDSDFPLTEIQELYQSYLKTFFRDIAASQGGKDALAVPQSFQGKKYKTWSSLAALLGKQSLSYGVDAELAEMTELMGEGLYTEKEEDFRQALSAAYETVGEKKEPEETEKTERFDRRFQEVLSYDGNDWSVLFDILKKNSKFLGHLWEDTDEEFSHFLGKITPAIQAVCEELKQHIYVDQYLIEREKEIHKLVLGGETKNVSTVLALTELDRAIEATKIRGKTFHELLRRELSMKKKVGPLDALYGSLVMDLVTRLGTSVVLEPQRLKEKKETLLENLKTLMNAFDRASDDFGLPGQERSALLWTVVQNDKERLLLASKEDYRSGIRESTKKELDRLLKEYLPAKEAKKTKTPEIERRKEIAAQKKSGRELYNILLDESQKTFSLLTIKEIDETLLDETIWEEIREITALYARFTADPFLENLYRAILKRVTLSAVNNDLEGVLQDKKRLYRLSYFSLAADLVLQDRKELSQTERFALKKGLFEYFATDLLRNTGFETDDLTEGIRYYKKRLGTVLAETEEKPETVRTLMDDAGGYTGVKAPMLETEAAFKEYVVQYIKTYQKDEAWKTIRKRIRDYSTDEVRLFTYFLQNSGPTEVLKTALDHLIVIPQEAYINLEDSAAVLSFIRGESLSAELLGIRYEKVTEILKQEGALHRFLKASELTDECIKTAALRRKKEVEAPKEPEDASVVVADMRRAYKTAEECLGELWNETELTDEDKLWRFYSVVRTYSDVLDRYQRFVEAGRISKKVQETTGTLYEAYRLLRECFSSEKRNPRLADRIYKRNFVRMMGIRRKDGRKALAMDEKRKEVNQIIFTHAVEKTELHRKPERRIEDQDEKDFAPDVVAAVKRIDRWIAENATRRHGDSDTGFSSEVLGRPLRERLFVYFLIENGKEKMPSELDAEIAVSGYVPDVAVFSKGMKNNILLRGLNLFREIDLVNDTGFLNALAKYETTKIEGVLRLLDNQTLKLDQYLEKYVAGMKPYQDQTLPEEVKTRQLCYIAFMKEETALRALIRGKTEKQLQKDPEVLNQAERLGHALSRLLKANEAVQEKWAEYSEEVIKSIDQKAMPWDFDGEQEASAIKDSTVVDKLAGISNLAAFLSTASTVAAPNLSAVGRIRNAAVLLEKLGLTLAKGATYFAPLGAIVDGPVRTILKVTGKTMAGGAALAKIAISGGQRGMVSKAAPGAKEFAEKQEKEQEKQPEEERDTKILLTDAVDSTIDIEKRTLNAEIIANVMRFLGSPLSVGAALLGAFMPEGHLSSIVSTASDFVSFGRMLYTFWARKDQREKTMDQFFDTDALCEKVFPMIKTMDAATAEKYGYYPHIPTPLFKTRIKERLRHEILRQMKFSSMEELFLDITQRYAAVLYRHIFFDQAGNQILANNEKAIAERRDLRRLFPNLRFTYPEKPGDPPGPCIEQMGWNLSRSIK